MLKRTYLLALAGILLLSVLPAGAQLRVSNGFRPIFLLPAGTVSIDQSTSAHGLPGCGSTGFPIVICSPGNYQLTTNLDMSTSADGVAVEIRANYVTLNLGGFTIACDAGEAAAFYCRNGVQSGNNDITLTNGIVEGFTTDVNLYGGNILVNKLTADSASTGIAIGSGVISNSTVSAAFGFSLANGTLTGSSATGSTGVIFAGTGGNAVQISNNQFTGNRSDSSVGVQLFYSGQFANVTNNVFLGFSYAFANGAVGYGLNTFANVGKLAYPGTTATSMLNNVCGSSLC